MFKPKYSRQYLENLIGRRGDFQALVELLCIVEYAGNYEDGVVPDWAKAFVHIINWQSMSVRSAAWTYYETVSREQLESVTGYLHLHAPTDLRNTFVLGIDRFEDEHLMSEIDHWISENEDHINDYLSQIIEHNKKHLFGIPVPIQDKSP